jgi:hypothetical protein
MARGLKVNIAFEALTEDYRRRVTVVLMAMVGELKALLAALNRSAAKARSARADTQEKARIT